jgi:hypothetical protein
MRYGRRLMVSLMVVFAIGAVAASAASAALPEFVSPAAAPIRFESILKTTKLETVGPSVHVVCKRGSNEGEVTGPKTLTMTVVLMGCTNSSTGDTCNSPEAIPGEIVVPSLTGTLGYIRKSTAVKGTEVGLALSSSAVPLATFACGGELEPHIVEGSVIGKLTPINNVVTPPERYKLTFTEKAGKQKPRKFEGGPEDILFISISSTLLVESGLSASDELIFSAPLEIRS